MNLLRNKNKEFEKQYWTKKYLSEQKNEEKKSGNNKPNSYKIAFILFLIVFILSISIYFYNYLQTKKFNENSLEASAKIVDYEYTNISGSFGMYTDHYYKYFYIVDGKKVYSSDRLDEYRHNDCIHKSYKKGDTITIRYNKKEPTKSKIKCN